MPVVSCFQCASPPLRPASLLAQRSSLHAPRPALQHRFQVQLVQGGPWLEYDQGVPVDETSRLAAVAAGAMPATAASGAAPGEPVEQPLGVQVKDLLQVS